MLFGKLHGTEPTHMMQLPGYRKNKDEKSGADSIYCFILELQTTITLVGAY